MIARIELPGCESHEWERFRTRKECEEWIEERLANLSYTRSTAGLRRQILNEKDAVKVRYRDGSQAYPLSES